MNRNKIKKLLNDAECCDIPVFDLEYAMKTWNMDYKKTQLILDVIECNFNVEDLKNSFIRKNTFDTKPIIIFCLGFSLNKQLAVKGFGSKGFFMTNAWSNKYLQDLLNEGCEPGYYLVDDIVNKNNKKDYLVNSFESAHPAIIAEIMQNYMTATRGKRILENSYSSFRYKSKVINIGMNNENGITLSLLGEIDKKRLKIQKPFLVKK